MTPAALAYDKHVFKLLIGWSYGVVVTGTGSPEAVDRDDARWIEARDNQRPAEAAVAP